MNTTLARMTAKRFFTATIALFLVACAAEARTADAPCSTQPTSGSPSSARRLMATVFERICGSSDHVTINVSINPLGQQPDSIGNVFVADDTGALRRDGRRAYAYAWFLDSVVTVTYDPRLRVLKRVDSMHGVRMEFNPAPNLVPRRAGSQ
jgi:hypothetical protein